MATLMEPKNKIIDSLKSSYTHGTDSVVEVNQISKWPTTGGGVFYLDDGDEWIMWEYGSVDAGLDQLQSLSAAEADNSSSGASGHTFPSGTVIVNARSVDYLLQVIKVLNGTNTWPAGQDAGDNPLSRLSALLDSAQSSPPSDPSTGDTYLDDGTNTDSGNIGWRAYDGASWIDLGGGIQGLA